MSNPFADQTIPLDVRVKCSDLALRCAAAWVTRIAAERSLNAARELSGRNQPALADAADAAFNAHSELAAQLRAAVNDMAERIS